MVIDDILFQAITGVCSQLSTVEYMAPESEFTILYTHFLGMANSRFKATDRTRTMKLLGNCKATPVDEIYGIMACYRVEIVSILGETREQA